MQINLALLFRTISTFFHFPTNLGLNTNISTNDPCSIGIKPVSTYNEVIACYSQFPLTKNIQEGVTKTLYKALPFYVFLDIATNSPDPKVPSKINIRKEFLKVANKKYENEWKFQDAITQFFYLLNDGHTEYRSYCFTSFIFKQPFPLVLIKDNIKGYQIKILNKIEHSKVFTKKWEQLGINISLYQGAEVLSIEGQEPLNYLIKFATERVGVSRDLNSRLSLTLAQVIHKDGKHGINYGEFATTRLTPIKENLTFTLKLNNNNNNKIVKITVPYLASPKDALHSFDNSKIFYKENCQPNLIHLKSSLNSISTQSKNDLNSIELLEVTKLKEHPMDAPLRLNSLQNLKLIKNTLTYGQTTKAFQLEEFKNIGVLRISEFSINSNNNENENENENENNNSLVWYKEVTNALKLFKKHNIQKLIIDLSNNYGGNVCYGYHLLDYLFPNSKFKRFNTDVSYKPLMIKTLMGFNETFIKNYNKIDGTPFNNSNSNLVKELNKIYHYKRGLIQDSKYTLPFQDKCDGNPFFKLMNNYSKISPFSSNDILVLTNTICYSTCALLSLSLKQFHQIKTIAFGGLPSSQATIASVVGGMVLPLESFQSSLEQLQLNYHPDAPPRFPTKSTFHFTLREAYSSIEFNKKNHHHHHYHQSEKLMKEWIPLEFHYNKADVHLLYDEDTVMNPYKRWVQAANWF